jgi:hypothetical protein
VDLERRLVNKSLMRARCVPLVDRHGREVAVVIAKLTIHAAADGAIKLPLQRDIRLVDEPTFEDRDSSVKFPTDLAPEKPGTDVILVGHAHPRERATEMLVGLRVVAEGVTLQKTLRVHGRRRWERGHGGIVPGPSAPLERTPLIYELAYGGLDDSVPDEVVFDPRNPVGRGVARDRAALHGTPAAVIEDPQQPLDSLRPAPAGFGAIDTSWSPRTERLGTADARWQRERGPVMPVDFDPRFYCASSPGLWSATPLAGTETIEVVGQTSEGLWRFALPRYAPRFDATVRGSSSAHPTHLDTLLIDVDERRVELVWRASIPLPRRTAHLERVVVDDEGVLPKSALDEPPEVVEYLARHERSAPAQGGD